MTLNNCLYKNSLKIHLTNPHTEETKSTIIFFWNLDVKIKKILDSDQIAQNKEELKKYFGNNWENILGLTIKVQGAAEDEYNQSKTIDEFEIDFKNIDTGKLELSDNILENVKLSKIVYITDLSIYPEDSIWNLRQKLYVATKIPIYRQHLFWQLGEFHQSYYSIFVQNVEYPITRKKDVKELLGIKIDNKIYTNRLSIRVKTMEPLTIMDDLIGQDLYLYDLADYLEPVDKTAILNNSYSFDLIFYSVIKKYFPIIDAQMFRLFLEDEAKLIMAYPLINVQRGQLRAKFELETKLLDDIYTNSQARYDEFAPQISTEIRKIRIDTKNIFKSQGRIVIRNLVDVLVSSETYLAIDAYITNQKSQYRVLKSWVGLDQNILDQITKKQKAFYGKEAIIIYYADENDIHQIRIFDDGTYIIKCGFLTSHSATFTTIIERTRKFIEPIITLIKENKNQLFHELPEYKIENLDIVKIQTKTRWNKVLSEGQFAQIAQILQEYYTAGIYESRASSNSLSIYNFKSVKGSSKNDIKFLMRKGVETPDYYVIFKDLNFNNVWNNRYIGEQVQIINNITYVSFEMHKMTAIKFMRNMNYLFAIMTKINKIPQDTRRIAKTTRKTKDKDFDPELYDFENAEGVKYARIVQKKHRPINAFVQEQFDKMTKAEQSKLFPYINFTTGETVYYQCPPDMPIFGFVVGQHPKGYCVPKCKETETGGVKNLKIKTLCTANRVVEGLKVNSRTHNDNVLKFGKRLPSADKLGFCHDVVYTVLDCSTDNLFITGYPRYFTNIIGGDILDIFSYQSEIAPNELIDQIAAGATEELWISMISTTMDYSRFVTELYNFRNNYTTYNINWTDIFVELIVNIFDIHIILLVTNVVIPAEILNKQNSYVEFKYLASSSKMFSKDAKIIVISELYDDHYPLVYLVPNEFESVLFTQADMSNKIAKKVAKLVESNTTRKSDMSIFEYQNLKAYIEKHGDASQIGSRIARKYVWNKVVRYIETDLAIIGCDDSPNSQDGIEEVYGDFRTTQIAHNHVPVLEFLKSNIKETPIFMCWNEHIHKVESCTDCKFVGCRVGKVFCWFAAATCEQISQVYPKFRTEFMNYDPFAVNKAITSNAPPVAEYLRDIHLTYYHIYAYKIFKCEFYKLLTSYRGDALRSALIKKYKANEIDDYIIQNKKRLTYSFNKIQILIKYSNDPLASLKTETFLEDAIDLKNHIMQAGAKLEPICKKYVKLVEEIPEFPLENIIYSPIEFANIEIGERGVVQFNVVTQKQNTLFYQDGKLKILSADWPHFIEMLTGDLQNDLLFRYEIIDFQLMFIINYLNFRNNEAERITIQLI